MRPNEYVLLNAEEDRDAAHRWNVANSIRKQRGSVRDKILKFLRANVGRGVTGEELRYVAGDKTEWARRVRELRHGVWLADRNKDHRAAGLGVGSTSCRPIGKALNMIGSIPDDVRREVLRRDGYKCRNATGRMKNGTRPTLDTWSCITSSITWRGECRG